MTAAGTTYTKAAVIGVTRLDALAQLRRQQRAGVIHSAGQVSRIEHGERAGQYAIPVYLIMTPRASPRRIPRWVWIVPVSVLVPVALLLLLGWVLASLTMVSLGMFLGAVLAAFLGWVWAVHGGGRRRTRVTTTVTID
jgi:hypothetical protein